MIPKTTDIDPDGIYTSEEAASFLRLDQETVLRKLRSGEIQATKVGRQWRIIGKNILSLIK